MGQQIQAELKKRQQQIADLEAELDRAYRIVEDLRKDNTELREQNAQLKHLVRQQPTVLQSEASFSSAAIPRQKIKHRVMREPDELTAWAQLSRFPFTVKVFIIVFATVLVGWVAMQFINRHSIESSQTEKERSALSPSPFPEPLSIPPSDSSSEFIPDPVFTPTPEQRSHSLNLVYNVTNPPRFQFSQDLQEIVDETVEMAASKGLPTDALSISLIDVKTSQFAEYQQTTFRYPASIVKLFWMVALYAQVEKGIMPAEAVFYTPECKTNICKMSQKSDNEAASRILDQLTNTTSQLQKTDKDYRTWLQKRQWVNRFFQQAGYTDINISQKNFPIPYLNMDKPQGFDLKMRGDPAKPLRNKMTTEQATRLMYEIFTSQSVSQKASEGMMQLLTRDLRPEVWQQEQYNSVEGFLSESLPMSEVYFASKVGWTASSRQEVAYIATKDGQAAYILTIFGDDPAYGSDWKIFPEMSSLIYKRIKEKE